VRYTSLSATGADDVNGFAAAAVALLGAGGLLGLFAASKRRRTQSASQK
jgi:hypothetical protein